MRKVSSLLKKLFHKETLTLHNYKIFTVFFHEYFVLVLIPKMSVVSALQPMF